MQKWHGLQNLGKIRLRHRWEIKSCLRELHSQLGENINVAAQSILYAKERRLFNAVDFFSHHQWTTSMLELIQLSLQGKKQLCVYVNSISSNEQPDRRTWKYSHTESACGKWGWILWGCCTVEDMKAGETSRVSSFQRLLNCGLDSVKWIVEDKPSILEAVEDTFRRCEISWLFYWEAFSAKIRFKIELVAKIIEAPHALERRTTLCYIVWTISTIQLSGHIKRSFNRLYAYGGFLLLTYI